MVFTPTELLSEASFEEAVKNMESCFSELFIYALVWSVGGILSGKSRKE
jgi:hypothetical protein